MEKFEQEIPWSGGRSIGVIGHDMDCDGTREYVKKMLKPDKIDQVMNFYGIPFIYKNEYKRFLKYRIQPRHYQVVQDHFYYQLQQEWYDVSDFEYGKLQEEYNIRVPVAEQTWLDLHINYDSFLEKDKAHRDAITKSNEKNNDDALTNMVTMMQQMQQQMQELQKKIGDPTVLLSKQDTNGWNEPSWDDSTRNVTNTTADKTATSHEDEKDWDVGTERTSNSDWSERVGWPIPGAEWPELTRSETDKMSDSVSDGLINSWTKDLFVVWDEQKKPAVGSKKDRRNG